MGQFIIGGSGGSGSGDMLASIYDPHNLQSQILVESIQIPQASVAAYDWSTLPLGQQVQITETTGAFPVVLNNVFAIESIYSQVIYHNFNNANTFNPAVIARLIFQPDTTIEILVPCHYDHVNNTITGFLTASYFVSQAGTSDPTASLIQSPISFVYPEFSRSGQGTYLMTLTNDGLTNLNLFGTSATKSQVAFHQTIDTMTSSIAVGQYISSTTVQCTTLDTVSNTNEDDRLSNTVMEITFIL